jgi:hypothetical protein
MRLTLISKIQRIHPLLMAGIALLCAGRTYCISINSIEQLPGRFKDAAIVTALKQYEATRPDIRQCDTAVLGGDSSAALLLRLYRGWRNATQEPRLKSDLVSGLLLLRLGETGLHWPYDTAKTLLTETARAYPENSIVAWMRGLRDIQSGELTQGIRSLDSLLITGFSDKTFLQDYSRSVAQALIPSRDILSYISIADTLPDTLAPVSYEWKIMRTHRKTGPALPCFSYGATFELCKPFHIVFSGLGKKSAPEMGLLSMPESDPAAGLLDQYLNRTRTEQARCRIFIDPNEPERTIPEFLARRINGCYDSIDQKSDLRGLRGISLRCYTLPRRFNQEGTYTAIVSFDRRVPDKQYSPRRKTLKKNATTVRYTLVVQSSLDAKDALEVKLQSLLRLF